MHMHSNDENEEPCLLKLLDKLYEDRDPVTNLKYLQKAEWKFLTHRTITSKLSRCEYTRINRRT